MRPCSMKTTIGFLGLWLGLAALLAPAQGQTIFPTGQAGISAGGVALMCVSGGVAKPCDATTPLQISGSFSATLSGFAPTPAYASLTATNASARVALPAGTVVVVYNTGTTAVSCTLGNGTVTAVANEDIIQPSSWLAYTVGSNADIACIDQTGSTSNVVVVSGGSGLPTGAGGGQGGSSSSITNWAGGVLGAMANYGSSPGAVLVPAVNAFVTNATTPGQAPMASSTPVTMASDQLGTCPNHAFKHITTATDTLAVQGVAAQTIRLCAWKARAAGTATWFWENTASANANCSSANTQISGVATEAANTGEVVALPLGITLNNTSGNGLCINSTGTGGVDIDYWYAQR